MKQILILISLFLISCSPIKKLEYNIDDKITLDLVSNKINRLDLYANDTLLIIKMPFKDAKKITLHNYQSGDYTFVFKDNSSIVQKVKLKISDNNINARN